MPPAHDAGGIFRPIFKKKRTRNMEGMEKVALDLVSGYIEEQLDKSEPVPKYGVFTVWKCKTLQNWKFLISSALHDGMYYEMTYNGDNREWYLDA